MFNMEEAMKGRSDRNLGGYVCSIDTDEQNAWHEFCVFGDGRDTWECCYHRNGYRVKCESGYGDRDELTNAVAACIVSNREMYNLARAWFERLQLKRKEENENG